MNVLGGDAARVTAVGVSQRNPVLVRATFYVAADQWVVRYVVVVQLKM